MIVDPTSIVSQIIPGRSLAGERTNTVREVCGNLTLRRYFRGETNGIPQNEIMLTAIGSSRPTLEPVFASSMSRTGTFTDWWEYQPIPGFTGSYIVSAAAADCPSGYNGVFVLYVTPVDWTNLPK
jgi:hypothetical protein